MATTTAKPMTLNWGYKKTVTAEEWILLADDLVSGSLDTMQQLDGDCYMSDYQKIMEFAQRLVNAASAIRGEDHG